ncbi:MAG: CHAD domain-containing protein [Candidatus Eremiobacteraeota bacterium]|nr:CHAD domain-containing protein [Candidatus Eremiobacteraeota bacterium]MBV8498677.1 CHAD domain-containing protein [Candidatus Eremiobacteraeota bacterium]
MKPERIDLRGAGDLDDIVRRVVQTRLREVEGLASGLERRDKQGLHDLRIACKRLRYALERFEELDPLLAKQAQHFSALQDALGEAHDRDVLLTILPPTMGKTQQRLQQERERCVDRAAELWKQPIGRDGSHEI